MARRKKKKKRHVWWKYSIEKFVFLILLAVFFLQYPGQNFYTRAIDSEGSVSLQQASLRLPDPADFPENVTGVRPDGLTTARGVVIVDVESGVNLFTRNPQLQLAPASTTKILTALVALDAFELDDVVTVQNVATEGQVMGLFPGESITIENLLYGLLVHSGNDAAYAIADAYPGGFGAFINAMNTKAKDVYMTNSIFTNPAGFDDEAHKMTPQDLANLSRVALKNTIIRKMVSLPAITVPDATHTYYHPLTNVNQLLGLVPGVSGFKTGWTEDAGESLVTLVSRNGREVVIVLLGSQDRFGETAVLVEWIYNNHRWKSLVTPES